VREHRIESVVERMQIGRVVAAVGQTDIEIACFFSKRKVILTMH